MMLILKRLLLFLGKISEMKRFLFLLCRVGGILARLRSRFFCQQYTQNITKETVKSIRVLETEILNFQEMAQLSGNQAYIDSLFLKKTALSDLQEMKAQVAF